MCGLFGCHTKEGAMDTLSQSQAIARRRIVESLGLAMQIRGKDSSGIAARKNGKSILCKTAHPASKLIEGKDFNAIMRENPESIIGHTRFATVGDVTARNAHPFKKGDIVGAHNGSVSNYKDFEIDGIEVDSEAIFELLNQNQNDYKSVFKRLYGNFAITWMDLKEKGVIFLAKESNPLSMIYCKDLKTHFWCSLEEHLIPIIRAVIGNNYTQIILDNNTAYKINSSNIIEKEDVAFKTYSSSAGKGSFYQQDYDRNKWQDYCGRNNSQTIYKDSYEDTPLLTPKKIPVDNRALKILGESALELLNSDFPKMMLSVKKRRFLRKYINKHTCTMCATILYDDDFVFYDRIANLFYCKDCMAEMMEYDKKAALLDIVQIPLQKYAEDAYC